MSKSSNKPSGSSAKAKAVGQSKATGKPKAKSQPKVKVQARKKSQAKAAGPVRMGSLQEGDKAPAFTGKDQNGQKVSLADHKGKKLVLYFYPQDDTPTCTVQACNLRDNYALLKKEGFAVLGVSPDDEKSHKKFETKFDLPFTLIADPEHTIIDNYGVWGEKQLYGRKYMGLHRTTFLIDEKGMIRKIFLKPKNKAHAEEIVETWKALS